MEPLWGASGTMLGASYLYNITKDIKWKNLFLKNSSFLISELKKEIDYGKDLWTQNMYGKVRQFTGAGHGYFGNIFAILKSQELLAAEDRTFILDQAATVLKKYVVLDGDCANWPPVIPMKEQNKFYNQWCHGAAGIITSLHNYPINYDLEVEHLLLKAGESVWLNGPHKKGIALCHGTDGNGFALLQLYKRTGDSLWLERARSFAMSAIKQGNKRFTLFTGDLGLAVYLISCLEEKSDLPLLDTL